MRASNQRFVVVHKYKLSRIPIATRLINAPPFCSCFTRSYLSQWGRFHVKCSRTDLNFPGLAVFANTREWRHSRGKKIHEARSVPDIAIPSGSRVRRYAQRNILPFSFLFFLENAFQRISNTWESIISTNTHAKNNLPSVTVQKRHSTNVLFSRYIIEIRRDVFS